nr:hypothetical protein [uncultured Rhodopila sp.]
MTVESGQPEPVSERGESDAGRAVNGGPSSGGFIFDPEIDDPYRDVLFEFIIAGTWEKALAVIDENREITDSRTFWEAAKEHISCCEDDTLREHLVEHCLIAFRHLTDDLQADERANLNRFPKPRPRGDVDKAHRIDSGREAAIDSGDREQEKRIAQAVLAIDPCATPVWLSLASLARRAGDQGTLRRCLRRLALSLMGELDIGLFALRHGVQKVARSYLESCLHSISGYEASLPRVAVTALTALANLHGDLAQYEAAVGYMRRACEIAGNCNRSSEDLVDEAEQQPYDPIDIVRLRTSLAYGLFRAG